MTGIDVFRDFRMRCEANLRCSSRRAKRSYSAITIQKLKSKMFDETVKQWRIGSTLPQKLARDRS